ncbi:hypothetical protein [Streptomyces sp. TRM68367]|nr:hypothetical protein [Streptomyces sp. TRM68367]
MRLDLEGDAGVPVRGSLVLAPAQVVTRRAGRSLASRAARRVTA